MTSLPEPFLSAPFTRFRDALAAMPAGELERRDVLAGRFELASGSGFAVHYAPFDHVNPDARLVLVGLTPGWQQTKVAFETARDRLRTGDSDERTLWAVKQRASVAGGVRPRLVQWLDGVGVGRSLGVASAAELFELDGRLLHTTSAIRYPVVSHGGTDWTGSDPSIAEPLLRDMVRFVLAPELRSLPDALVVPLGAAVQSGMRDLVDRGDLDPDRCLFGFPERSAARLRGPEAARARTTTRQRPGLPQARAGIDARSPDRPSLERLMLDALASLGGQAQRQSIKRRALALAALEPHPDQLSQQLDSALNALHRQRRVRRVGSGDWALR